MESRRTHTTVGLLSLGVLVAIGWYAYWSVPQAPLIPGHKRFVVLFSIGMAIPYFAIVGLLLRQDGREGVKLACGTAFVNALWSLPLGGVLVLLSGFALGNSAQLYSILGVAVAALLQLPLLAVSGISLWRTRKLAGHGSGGWALAFLLPIVTSGTSGAYFEWQEKAFTARSHQAEMNSRTAQETVRDLQQCLAAYQGKGYPVTLAPCLDGVLRDRVAGGYQFQYVPALAESSGRINAYQLCAQPREFRATGFETVVADSTGIYGAGVAERATLERPPTCVSVLAVDRALVWCAYLEAARQSSSGYPKTLSDMASCIGAYGGLSQVGQDRLTMQDGDVYAYIAGSADASGRVSSFRVYRLRHRTGQSIWIDEQLQQYVKSETPPRLKTALPPSAVPEQFEPGCLAGRGDDCYLAGREWERKARQAPGGERDPANVPLLRAAQTAYARGCELRDAYSCVDVGSELERGDFVPRDLVRAASLYEQACALGDALGCRYGGSLFESGRKAKVQSLQPQLPPEPPGVDLPKDVPHAVELYGRACELYDEEACFIAGRLLAAGEGMPADSARALRFFADLCNGGMAQACSRAADLAPHHRADYLRRACILSEASLCL